MAGTEQLPASFEGNVDREQREHVSQMQGGQAEGAEGRQASAPQSGAADTPRLVVLGKEHCFPYTTVLLLNEKPGNRSMDDTEVVDTKGDVHFRVKSKLVSSKNRRALYDALDKPVCCSVGKTGLKKGNFICFGDSFNPDLSMAEVKKSLLSLSPHLEVYLRGNESKTPDVEIVGNITSKEFQMKNKEGEVIADVTRKPSTVSGILTGADNYQVIIHPGIDIAFISFLVCTIEEIVIEPNLNKMT